VTAVTAAEAETRHVAWAKRL